MSDDIDNRDLADLTAERDRLLAERARLRVAMDTGLPVQLLGNAANEEQARAIAEQAIAWRSQSAAPAAPAPAPQYAVGQVSRSTLGQLDSDDIMVLYKGGRLQQACGLPPGTQNGQH